MHTFMLVNDNKLVVLVEELSVDLRTSTTVVVNMKRFIAGLLVFQIWFVIIVQVDSDKELIFVTVLFRHGDRTPILPYPKDPYANISYWPDGWGQLTNRGKQQMYDLGKWLRNRYNNFLPNKYSFKDIYTISSDRDRTIMSAIMVLASLYYPNKSDSWNPNLQWQPIPVHTIPENDDAIILYNKKCPSLETEKKDVYKIKDVQLKLHEMEPLFDYIMNSINMSNTNYLRRIKYFWLIYDGLIIESLNNLETPAWAKEIFPNRMRPYFNYLFKLSSYTKKMRRLHSGLLLREILDRYDKKINNTLQPDRKMWIYSGHDSTMVDFLMTMGHDSDDIMPSYGSTILFELYRENGEYFVKLTYRKSSDDIIELSMLGCATLCPLDELKQLLQPVLITPDEWEVECQELPVPYALTVIAIVLICLVSLVLLTFFIICCIRRFVMKKLPMDKMF